MAGRVIQGFFLGGGRLAPPTAPRVQPMPVQRQVAPAGARPMPGPPAAAFVHVGGQPVQQRIAPGRPAPVHATAVPGDNRMLQRFGGDGSFAIDPAQVGLVRGGGKPLPQTLLAKMEAAFGADFSGVRVHVGPQASRIGALAFTTGSDLYFAPGQYQPDSIKGQQLIGHELAHVIQQRQGRVRAPGSGVAVVQDRALEAEADRLGMKAANIFDRAAVRTSSFTPGANKYFIRDNDARLASYPARPVQCMESSSSSSSGSLEILEELSNGSRIVFNSSSESGYPGVELRSGDNKLVALVTAQMSGKDIFLHTKTLSGVEGGQGYYGLLAIHALRMVQNVFSRKGIEKIVLNVAAGAAMKGLISIFARIRARISVNQAQNDPDGAKYLDIANEIRKKRMDLRRQEFEKTSNKIKNFFGGFFSSPPSNTVNKWQPDLMKETIWELRSIRQFETTSELNVEVFGGAGSGFGGYLVGKDSTDTSAHDWYVAATESPSETLPTMFITIPFSKIVLLIEAAESLKG